MLSLGLSLSIAWASTGWFARDVLATSERREMRLDFKQYIADQTRLEATRSRQQTNAYSVLLKEKDARIQELTSELSILTTKTTRAAEDADKAATNINKATTNINELMHRQPTIIVTPPTPGIHVLPPVKE